MKDLFTNSLLEEKNAGIIWLGLWIAIFTIVGFTVCWLWIEGILFDSHAGTQADSLLVLISLVGLFCLTRWRKAKLHSK